MESKTTDFKLIQLLLEAPFPIEAHSSDLSRGKKTPLTSVKAQYIVEIYCKIVSCVLNMGCNLFLHPTKRGKTQLSWRIILFGYIKKHRNRQNHKFYKLPNVMRIWDHLDLQAHHGHEPTYDGYQNKIERGQLSTGIMRLAKETGMFRLFALHPIKAL